MLLAAAFLLSCKSVIAVAQPRVDIRYFDIDYVLIRRCADVSIEDNISSFISAADRWINKNTPNACFFARKLVIHCFRAGTSAQYTRAGDIALSAFPFFTTATACVDPWEIAV